MFVRRKKYEQALDRIERLQQRVLDEQQETRFTRESLTASRDAFERLRADFNTVQDRYTVLRRLVTEKLDAIQSAISHTKTMTSELRAAAIENDKAPEEPHAQPKTN